MALTMPRPARTAPAAPRDSAPRPRIPLDFAALYLPFAILVGLTFANTPDDALITLRFAHNLVTAGQPVYNLGDRIEGYTSPLHLLLASVALWLPGGLALLKMKLLSVLFAAAALWQLRRLLIALSISGWARIFAMVLVSASWSFATSASNGLETSLVALLGTGLAAGLAAGSSNRQLAVWGALFAVTRPECVLVIALLAVASLAVSPRGTRWRSTRWLIGPVVSFGALMVFRIAYYGAFLPNTYYAKSRPLSTTLGQGLHYLVDWQPWGARYHSLAVILAIVQLVLLLVAVAALPSNRRLAFPLALVVGQVVAVLQAGGDWMRGGRFLVPALPAAAVLMAAGLTVLIRRRYQAAGVVLAGAFVAGMAAPIGPELAPVWSLRGASAPALVARSNNWPISNMWLQAVDAVACLHKGQTLAYSEAGLLAVMRPDLNIIDTRGLTDREIATSAPTSGKTYWGVVERRWFSPRSVVGRVLRERRPAMVLEFDSYPEPTAVNGLYRLHRVISFREGRPLSIYVRRDLSCNS